MTVSVKITKVKNRRRKNGNKSFVAIANTNKKKVSSKQKEFKMSRQIEISDETYEKLKDQLCAEGCVEINSLKDMVGKKFFFRTITYHLTGRVKKVIGSILELEDAAWIADSGRFNEALKNGTLNEVEPCGVCFININSLTDFFPWKHELPTKVK